jgi:hypothetical protein
MDNACRLLGGARRLATLVHYADDLGRENRLGLFKVGIRHAEVAEHFAATADQFDAVHAYLFPDLPAIASMISLGRRLIAIK